MIDLSRATWRKSTYSTPTGEQCVELARVPGVVAVRDSKNPDGGALTLTPAVMRAFAADIRAGRHDL